MLWLCALDLSKEENCYYLCHICWLTKLKCLCINGLLMGNMTCKRCILEVKTIAVILGIFILHLALLKLNVFVRRKKLKFQWKGHRPILRISKHYSL